MDCEQDRNLNLHDDTDYPDYPASSPSATRYRFFPLTDCQCPLCTKAKEEADIEQDLMIDDTWVDFDDMRIWSATEQEPDGDARDYNAF